MEVIDLRERQRRPIQRDQGLEPKVGIVIKGEATAGERAFRRSDLRDVSSPVGQTVAESIHSAPSTEGALRPGAKGLKHQATSLQAEQQAQFPKPGPYMTRSSQSPLRIGILSTANIARAFVKGVQPSSRVTVVGVASRDGSKAERFASEVGVPRSYNSYEALLADSEIDAIYNPLPNSLHAPWSIRAAEAG